MEAHRSTAPTRPTRRSHSRASSLPCYAVPHASKAAPAHSKGCLLCVAAGTSQSVWLYGWPLAEALYSARRCREAAGLRGSWGGLAWPQASVCALVAAGRIPGPGAGPGGRGCPW